MTVIKRGADQVLLQKQWTLRSYGSTVPLDPNLFAYFGWCAYPARRCLMRRKTGLPRNGKFWTTIFLWKPLAIKMRCYYSLGAPFLSSTWRRDVPYSVLWENESTCVIDSLGRIPFKRSLDSSNVLYFPAKISSYFKSPDNYWDYSNHSRPASVLHFISTQHFEQIPNYDLSMWLSCATLTIPTNNMLLTRQFVPNKLTV